MPALRTRDTQSRSLEVTTDTPQPPTLAIISPTPRAFTFPITHNLADSPYSSPSHSPFEPDLRSLALSSSSCVTPPPPPFMRTLSPDSSLTSVSPAPSHKRRKSSCSSDIVERRPKKGDEDYIKRPENAFILFRRKCCEDRQAAQEEASADGPTKKQRQADLSKTISQQWKSLSAEERQYWEQLAKEKKKEHEQMYPNYVYRPQRAKDKDGRSKGKKVKGRKDSEAGDSDSVSFVVPVVQHHRHHGRSASAPTPPPYQSIQIPNVYQMTPSCPTSPSLLPMISRRSSHPDHPEDPMSNFDFQPNEAFMSPPSFGQFEASLQSSEFLRSMFSMAGVPQRESLHPLDVSQEAMLLPPHQSISPSSSAGSGSSGPSSPCSGPFTPSSAVLSQSFSRLSTSNEPSQPEPRSQAEIDLQMEMQLQQEYAQYSWETNQLWSNGNSELLLGDDFDLSAIPPIELGVPKYQEQQAPMQLNGGMEYHPEYQQEFSQEYAQPMEARHFAEDGVLAFDEVMASHGF
ncbi:putative high mobility group [Lyophyllum shimeji]|uniref:High mobility group n=1 Tax=Lyophyllum shimeji TaxID=47721 RepID=A0A9P3PVS3_LYOSH|nr:putative high mobility group [Lyophyllum shimeji]